MRPAGDLRVDRAASSSTLSVRPRSPASRRLRSPCGSARSGTWHLARPSATRMAMPPQTPGTSPRARRRTRAELSRAPDAGVESHADVNRTTTCSAFRPSGAAQDVSRALRPPSTTSLRPCAEGRFAARARPRVHRWPAARTPPAAVPHGARRRPLEPVGATEKCVDDLLVLLGLARAGRVHEPAARRDDVARRAAASRAAPIREAAGRPGCTPPTDVRIAPQRCRGPSRARRPARVEAVHERQRRSRLRLDDATVRCRPLAATVSRRSATRRPRTSQATTSRSPARAAAMASSSRQARRTCPAPRSPALRPCEERQRSATPRPARRTTRRQPKRRAADARRVDDEAVRRVGGGGRSDPVRGEPLRERVPGVPRDGWRAASAAPADCRTCSRARPFEAHAVVASARPASGDATASR